MSGAVTAVAVTLAAMTVAEVFTAVAVAGAVIGAIGTVTHVKELQIAGMVLGAVGGIGGLAASAGMFAADAAMELGTQAGGALADTAAGTTLAETASPFAAAGEMAGAPTVAAVAPAIDTTADIVDMASGNVAQVGDASLPVTTPGSMTAELQTSAEGPLSGVAENTVSPNVTPDVANTGTWEPGQPPVDTLPAPQAPSVMNTPTPATPTVAAPAAPTTTTAPAPPDVTGAPLPGSTVTGTPLPQDAGVPGSFDAAQAAVTKVGPTSLNPTNPFNDILSFVGKPGVSTLLSGAIQAGGAFIGGATSSLTPAQVAAYNAQAQANLAAANLTQTQINNMSQGVPKATRVPVTGLINSPPPVTGAPA